MAYNIGSIRKKALEKIAFFGDASVVGAPSYIYPQPTVGQMLYNANSRYCPINDFSLNNSQRRLITDNIVSTGIPVNSPAKRLLHAGIGALASNFVSNVLKVGPFTRGLITATGAHYGYNH